MSERKIGDGQGNAILEYAVCANACTGAPVSIQPGAVVALAKALEEILSELDRHRSDPVNQQWMGSPMREKARAALALYNGTGGGG